MDKMAGSIDACRAGQTAENCRDRRSRKTTKTVEQLTAPGGRFANQNRGLETPLADQDLGAKRAAPGLKFMAPPGRKLAASSPGHSPKKLAAGRPGAGPKIRNSWPHLWEPLGPELGVARAPAGPHQTARRPGKQRQERICYEIAGLLAPSAKAPGLNPTVPHFPYGMGNQLVFCKKIQHFAVGRATMENAQRCPEV